MENRGGQKDCRGGVLLSGKVSGVIIGASVLQMLGASAGITKCGSTMGRMVGIVDVYFAGSCWWLIFELGRMSEVSMRTSGKVGGLGVGTSSQMGSRNGAMGRKWVAGVVGGNVWDVLCGQGSDIISV